MEIQKFNELYDRLKEAAVFFATIVTDDDDDPRYDEWAQLMEKAEELVSEDHRIAGTLCHFGPGMTKLQLIRLLRDPYEPAPH